MNMQAHLMSGAKTVEKYGYKFSFNIVKIDRSLAKQIWEASHSGNRRLIKHNLKKCIHAMKSGEWKPSSTLLFDKDVRLLNGRHRIAAVIESGVECIFCIIIGYDWSEIFGIHDTGASKQLYSFFEMAGEENAKVLATVVRMAWLHDQGKSPFQTGRADSIFSVSQASEFLECNPDIRKSIKSTTTVGRLIPHSITAFFHYIFSKIDRADADAFFHDLNVCEDDRHDPIAILKEKLLINKESRNRMSRVEMGAIIIKTWNAMRQGKTIERLWFGKNECFPAIEETFMGSR